jgi:hypothetical protein
MVESIGSVGGSCDSGATIRADRGMSFCLERHQRFPLCSFENG